jgi:uncharacterized phage protein gp47/JayE
LPFDRPTLSTILTRTRADIQSRLAGSDAYLRRSVEGVLARVVAGVAHGLYGFLDWISDQVLPDTAEAAYLDRWASIWGVVRNAATQSNGPCTFTGVNTTLLPEGTQIQVGDYTYTTDADGTVSGGSVTVNVTSEEAGVATQAEAGQIASLVSPIAGIDSDGVVATGGLVGGADKETDAELLVRLLERIQDPPKGGGPGDYVRWAKEVSGVTRAWEFNDWTGVGTVGVLFVRDNDTPIIPDSGEVADVQDYIDSVCPITADVTVLAPTAVSLNPNITVSPNTATVKAAVEAELEDLLYRIAEPDKILYVSQISEAISNAEGEDYHVLNSPTSNIVYTKYQVGVLGTITWT